MTALTRTRRISRWTTISSITACAALVGVPAGAATGPNGVPVPNPYGFQRTHGVSNSAMSPAISSVDSGDGGGKNGESDEIAEGAAQYAQERTAPGTVSPGAYTAAWNQLNALHKTGGAWTHVTGLTYNSDDPRYRDYDSNSSGGAGDVTGRTAALAADNDGYVYTGSAGGGVWRSRTGGGKWQPISDQLPTQSTGALAVNDGRLWLGTGEATTNADALLGSGVYVLSNPHHGRFTGRDRVGGSELDSTTVHELRFGGGTVWAATSRGVWSHSSTDLRGPWKMEFVPQLKPGPDGRLYAATHGRGIWSIDARRLH